MPENKISIFHFIALLSLFILASSVGSIALIKNNIVIYMVERNEKPIKAYIRST